MSLVCALDELRIPPRESRKNGEREIERRAYVPSGDVISPNYRRATLTSVNIPPAAVISFSPGTVINDCLASNNCDANRAISTFNRIVSIADYKAERNIVCESRCACITLLEGET